MKLSPLSVVAVFASFAASAEAMFGLDDESSSEQGQRGLTCYKPKCKPEDNCVDHAAKRCPRGKLDFNDKCFFEGDRGPYIGALPLYGVHITGYKETSTAGHFNTYKSVARLLNTGLKECSTQQEGVYGSKVDDDLMSPSNHFCIKKDLYLEHKDEWKKYPVVNWLGHACDIDTVKSELGCGGHGQPVCPAYERGLGYGGGGEATNTHFEGNVLIVEERGINCDCPDDAGIGGILKFEFFEPMKIDHVALSDIDDPLPKITFFYENGSSSYIYGENVGNNGIWRKDFVVGHTTYPVQENVIKMEVYFPSSGAVSAINYHCQDAHSNGDPHFTTWSGEHFDFQGECDLVLVDNPTFKTDVGMYIHGRTKLHGSWSAFSSVAVKMGEDVLEVHGSAAPFINGVELPVAPMEYGAEFLLPIKLAGFDVSVQNTGPNSRKYIIHLGKGERIFINNFKEFVDLDIENVQSSEFMGSSGLLGNFNAGTNLGRDGKTVIEDEDVLGQEWQVTDTDPQLFTLVDGPQYPAKCNMPEKLSAAQRHLRALNKKVSEDDAKNACANAKPDRMQNCIADVFGSDNIDMAGIYTVHSF